MQDFFLQARIHTLGNPDQEGRLWGGGGEGEDDDSENKIDEKETNLNLNKLSAARTEEMAISTLIKKLLVYNVYYNVYNVYYNVYNVN